MNKPGVLLIIVFCLAIAQKIYSQHYFTKSYSIENGLSTRVVNDACQDGNGTMWFATVNGISSYDGFSFTNYDTTYGLPRQHYRKVKYDDKGLLWGVPYFLSDTIIWMQNNIWRRIIPIRKTAEIEVASFDILYKKNQPVICVGSKIGLDIYQNGQWAHVEDLKIGKRNNVLSVISKNGKFYVLTREGVWVGVEGKSNWRFEEFIKFNDGSIIAMKFERPGKIDEKLWLLSLKRLSYLQNGKLTQFADGFNLPESEINSSACLNFDNRGNIFFGNNWAKYCVNINHGLPAPLMVSNGLSSDGATSIFIDREQNVWFTDTRGIDKISSLLLLKYFVTNGLLDNEVTAIVELADGRMVFGHNNGLSVYDHQTFKRIAFPFPNDNLSRVLDIIQDNQGNVWFAASSRGFGKLNVDGTIKWYKEDTASFATVVRQDAKGVIWFGTGRNLYYLENDKLVAFKQRNQLNLPFRRLFTVKQGGIVGAGTGGLIFILGDKVRKAKVDKTLKTQSVYSYYRSESGTEYVGTVNGLCILENGVIRKFNHNGIHIDSPVYFIFQDHNQTFWFGSNNGVYKWNGHQKFEVLSLKNGLAGREANRSAGLVDSHGNVWIGMDMGLSCFLSGFFNQKIETPVIKLLDIEDNRGNYHSFEKKCTIGYNDNTLLFHFRGISFQNEDLISYRYKLVGFDCDWQYVSQSNLDKVKYAGINPGEYQLIVQARNFSGEWSEVTESGMITIKAPVYKTLWFNLILIGLIIAVFLGVIRIILQRKYNHQLENEILERRLSEQKTLQTLESLHISELRYRELIESAVDGILIVSKSGTMTEANSCMQHLTARTAENLVSRHVNELFSDHDLNTQPLRFDLLELGKVVVSHREIIRPDGTLIPVEMHTKMMPDGSYQSIYHDITNRLLAEKQLSESRELYRLITNKMTDVVWLMDLTGKSTFVSPSIEQFTGFTVDAYLQQSFDDRFTPDSALAAKVFFNNEMAKLKSQPEILHIYSYTQHFEYICKNGGTKWSELLITPYFGHGNEWLGIHGVTRDITFRKLAEKALFIKANELERFNSLMVGRELKMIELKKEINELLIQAGKPGKYIIHE